MTFRAYALLQFLFNLPHDTDIAYKLNSYGRDSLHGLEYLLSIAWQNYHLGLQST